MFLKDILNKINFNQQVNNIKINGLNTLLNASQEHISFFDNKKYINDLSKTKAKAVFIKEEYISHLPQHTIALTTSEPYLNMALCTKLFAKPLLLTSGNKHTIGNNSQIDKSVYLGFEGNIGNNVTILANSYIGDRVSIGDGVIIYPNVTIYNDSVIGNNVIIQAGSVIGSEGFGYAHTKDSKAIKIYHLGKVILEESVEIGANCTLDRAVYGVTRVGSGTKIDNLVHLAHNVDIGQDCFIAGQCGFAGSTSMGDRVMFGAQAGAAGHLHIDSNSTIFARGGVTKSLKSGQWAGFPIMPHRKWLVKEAKINKLI